MAVDFSDLIPTKPQVNAVSFDDLIPKQTGMSAYREAGTEPSDLSSKASTPSYVEPGTEAPDLSGGTPATDTTLGKIANAAAQGWKDTPSILAQPAQDFLDQSPVGRQIVNPAFKIASAIPAGTNALMHTIAETVNQVTGDPRVGRDVMAALQILPIMGGMAPPNLSAAALARIPVSRRPQYIAEHTAPDVSELDPRNAISSLIQHDMAEKPVLRRDSGTANRSIEAAGDKVTQTPDLDSAIATARDAAGVGARTADAGGLADLSGTPEAPAPVAVSLPTPQAISTAVARGDIPKTTIAAKQVASAYYKRAEQLGGDLTPDFTNNFLGEADALLPQTRAGKIVAGEGPMSSLIERIQELRDGPLSLREAQEIDEGIGNLVDGEYGVKGLSKEGYNLLKLQTTFRNMIADAGPNEVVGGTEGFDSLVLARKAWSQAMKLDDLERIQNRANLQEVPSTGIRTGIRTLLSNPSRVRGYSMDEIAALRQAADRGVIGSALNVFGSRLMPIAVGAHGLATLNPASLGAAALGYGVSTLARNAATRLQTGRLNNAMETIGRGVPALPEASP